MAYLQDNPIIVQNDFTILLEAAHPDFAEIRGFLNGFADLIRSPEHIYTYRMSKLALYNAIARGITAEEIISGLQKWNKYSVPLPVISLIKDAFQRYGEICLEREDDKLYLSFRDEETLREVWHYPPLRDFFISRSHLRIEISSAARGRVKQILLQHDYPVDDRAGFIEGQPLAIELVDRLASGEAFNLRPYQQEAVHAFYNPVEKLSGNGVIVLPCGSGKTLVGIGVMAALQQETLIITTGGTSAEQWRDELLDKTDISPAEIGEYTAAKKNLRPVTITTYHMLSYRSPGSEDYPHLELFKQKDWGLIIYDEVHLLPAPVFRATIEVQAQRRLGLTATLVREDGLEGDVFSLIGPKRFDMPWAVLERQGYLAPVKCYEIRVPLADESRVGYAAAGKKERFRLASENAAKAEMVDFLLKRHRNDAVLIIGQYLEQLEKLAERFDLPFLSGSTPMRRRQELYALFRTGEITALVLSKVANFAVDLPVANVAIQVSGSFGSRQEEAQRLGRILRPELDKQSYFYTLVTADSPEQEFARKRQIFLAEQGYLYRILTARDIELI